MDLGFVFYLPKPKGNIEEKDQLNNKMYFYLEDRLIYLGCFKINSAGKEENLIYRNRIETFWEKRGYKDFGKNLFLDIESFNKKPISKKSWFSFDTSYLIERQSLLNMEKKYKCGISQEPEFINKYKKEIESRTSYINKFFSNKTGFKRKTYIFSSDSWCWNLQKLDKFFSQILN